MGFGKKSNQGASGMPDLPELTHEVEQFEMAKPAMHAVDDRVEPKRMPEPTAVPAGRMADYLHGLFEIGDTNGDGVLSPEECAKLLSRSGFNFPEDVIDALVSAADVNEDGVIEYDEFVPAMLGLMQQELPAFRSPTASSPTTTSLASRSQPSDSPPSPHLQHLWDARLHAYIYHPN